MSKIVQKLEKGLVKFPFLYNNFEDVIYYIPRYIKGKKKFKKDIKLYTEMNRRDSLKIEKKYMYPCLTDYRNSAGRLGVYFWQDLWAARLIAKNSSEEDAHYDIGSRIDGFISHLASFRGNIHLIDIRPLDIQIPGVDFKQADATNLDGIPDNSIQSISALCSLEHFGLGRYGDPIDPEGFFKAIKSVARVLDFGGHAYLSVPIGREHLEFNAHRVFYASTVIEAAAPMKLVELSCITNDRIHYNIDIHKYDKDDTIHGETIGLFHFTK